MCTHTLVAVPLSEGEEGWVRCECAVVRYEYLVSALRQYFLFLLFRLLSQPTIDRMIFEFNYPILYSLNRIHAAHVCGFCDLCNDKRTFCVCSRVHVVLVESICQKKVKYSVYSVPFIVFDSTSTHKENMRLIYVGRREGWYRIYKMIRLAAGCYWV